MECCSNTDVCLGCYKKCHASNGTCPLCREVIGAAPIVLDATGAGGRGLPDFASELPRTGTLQETVAELRRTINYRSPLDSVAVLLRYLVAVNGTPFPEKPKARPADNPLLQTASASFSSGTAPATPKLRRTCRTASPASRSRT